MARATRYRAGIQRHRIEPSRPQRRDGSTPGYHSWRFHGRSECLNPRAAWNTGLPIMAIVISRFICGAPSPSPWATRARCWASRWSASPTRPPASTIVIAISPSCSTPSSAAYWRPGPADRIPHHLARRGLSQPDQPQVPQPDVDRYRGNDPRAADGCGRADGRMRQDRAGATDGRRVRRPAGDHAGGGPDDDRPPPRRAARRLHGLPAILGALPRRRRRRRRDLGGRGPARGYRRHLRGHGHGLHHGLPRGGARPDPAGNRGHPGRACGPVARGGSNRGGGGGSGRVAAHARPHRRRQGGGKRLARAARPRRVDQCGDPSHRDRRPRRRRVSLEQLNGCPKRPRCWSISSRSDRAIWRISSPPAAWARCCGSSSRCSTSIA